MVQLWIIFDEIQLYFNIFYAASHLYIVTTIHKKIMCRKTKFLAKPSVLTEGFCELLKINYVAEVE